MTAPHRVVLAAAVMAGVAPSPSALAQTYPAKPVRLIIAYAAGGGTDIVGRVFAQKLGDGLGKPVIVDNRPGAAGNIATELAVKAPADGYTLLMGNIGPIAVNPHLYKLALGSLRDLVALARRQPGALTYSSAGVGSSNHLAGALFAIETSTQITHVPYKGASPAVTDLMAGNVQLSFQTLPSVGSAMRAKRVKALAVTSSKRSSAYPDIPTAKEAGVEGFEVNAWYSIVAPAGTPRPIIDRLHAELSNALKQPDVIERLKAEGAEPAGLPPDEFAQFMRTETAKWGRVVKLSGMKAE